MGGLFEFLGVLVCHVSWNGLCTCLSAGNGQRPYDFLITRCLRHWIAAPLHLVIMLAGGFPLAYGCYHHAFTPWSQGLAVAEACSYYARVLVTTIFGAFLSNACLLPKDRRGKSWPRPDKHPYHSA